jgi:ABC-type transporter Mla subunit MlaD
MVDNPIDLLIRSQQIALKLAGDTLRTVTNAAYTGVTQPEELVRQVGDLAGAVAGMANAITGLAGATAQPLQDFIVRQRELADTVAMLADAQADLAGVVAKLAERHADAVTALEKVTAPVFAIVGTDPTPPRARAKQAATAKPQKSTKPKPAAK